MLFKERTLVVKLQNSYVLFHKTLKIVHCKIKKDFIHSLIHKYERKTNSFGFLNRLLKDHRRILKLDGSKRVNLVIFLYFDNPNNSLFERMLVDDCKKVTDVQKILIKIILKDFTTLKMILKKNPRLFLNLVKKLKIKGIFEREIRALRCFKASKTYKNKRDHYNKNTVIPSDKNTVIHSDKNTVIHSDKNTVIHSEFCKDRDVADVEDRNIAVGLKDCYTNSSNAKTDNLFLSSYQKMIDGIKNNDISTEIIPNNPFYPEIALYNEFLFSQIDLSSFDQSLFDRSFTTENELIVKDFIQSKLI